MPCGVLPNLFQQFYRHEVHRRFVSTSVLFAASPSPSALPPASSLDPPLKNAWGQRIIPLNDLSPPPSSAVLDLTDDLLRRGIPELADIKEGLVFFQLQQPPHPGRDSARAPDKAIVASPAPTLGQGDASSPSQAWLSLSLQSPGDGLAAPASEGRARLLGLPLRNGRLQDPQARPGAPRILLNLPPSSMDNSSPPIHPSSTITVTWNGDKIRTGSSHRCAATREDAVVPARKAALDAALTSLGTSLPISRLPPLPPLLPPLASVRVLTVLRSSRRANQWPPPPRLISLPLPPALPPSPPPRHRPPGPQSRRPGHRKRLFGPTFLLLFRAAPPPQAARPR